MEKLPLDRARWPFIALLASAAVLAVAHGFERFGGYMPCHLCYQQRQIHWLVGGIALLAIAINWRGVNPRLMAGLCVAIGLVFVGSFALAGYHSLVEWKILPAPLTCTAAPITVTAESIIDQLNKPMHPPSCGDAAWRDPVTTLSMAGWNAILSLILAALSFFSATRPMRTDTANERIDIGDGQNTEAA